MQVDKKASLGSWSEVAEYYPAFPDYSRRLLQMLVDEVKHLTQSPIFGDIGASTGAIVYALAEMGAMQLNPRVRWLRWGRRSTQPIEPYHGSMRQENARAWPTIARLGSLQHVVP